LTITQFNGLLEEVGTISRLENGVEKEDVSLEGENGFKLAKQIFKKGKNG